MKGQQFLPNRQDALIANGLEWQVIDLPQFYGQKTAIMGETGRGGVTLVEDAACFWVFGATLRV